MATKKQTNKKPTNKQTVQEEQVIGQTNMLVPVTTTGLTVTDEVKEKVEVLVGELQTKEEIEQLEMTGQNDDDQPIDDQPEQTDLVGQDDGQEQEGDDQPEQDMGGKKVEDMTREELLAMIELMAKTQQQQPVTSDHAILKGNDDTKAAKAREIWNEEVTKLKGQCPVRSTTIARFQSEAGLTKAGAATYYQNYKKKAGFVNSK